jgi:hypothetical protein
MELDHIALTVESLRQAENLYKRLFDLEVLYREGSTPEGFVHWDGEGLGENPTEETVVEKSCLESHGIRLMLLLKTLVDYPTQGRIDHICLRMSRSALSRLLMQAEALDCRILQNSDQTLWIEDPYGVRWRVVASDCE